MDEIKIVAGVKLYYTTLNHKCHRCGSFLRKVEYKKFNTYAIECPKCHIITKDDNWSSLQKALKFYYED